MGLLDAILDPRFRRDVAQGLLDAGNRGVVAGLLGAPVDMASGVANAGRMAVGFLGNKAGLLSADQMPQPIEKPVGGSEWIGDLMQRAGMVSGNRNPVAETLAGAVLPVAAVPAGRALYRAEQAAPAVARDFASTPSVQNAVNGYMERMGMKLPITVWHGSPHKFDKFDASKIGTGEGAQAYGHGLYLAESPEVARGYSAMADQNPTAQQYLKMWGGDKEKALAAFEKHLQDGAFGNIDASKAQDVAASIMGKGSLYKVDLPDSAVAKMLDWDKPLSQQAPEVQKALAKTKNKQLRAVVDYASSPYSTPGLEGEVKTMGEAIKLLGMNASPAKGSAMLAKQGIPGIKYLDGGSRGTGAGTSNFVIFPQNEGLLTILERNGIPLP